MSTNFQMSTVYILDPECISTIDNRTLGTGFIISTDGLITTCAHVLQTMKFDESVPLIFYNPAEAKDRRTVRMARVISAYFREAEDIAFLRLEGPLPDNVLPLPLGNALFTRDQTFLTFGFPQAKSEDGMFAECKILGRGSDDTLPMLQVSSSQISKGFSGAPLWDDQRQCVIGMVNGIIGAKSLKLSGVWLSLPFDQDWRQMETSFVTPSEMLQQVCPLLQILEECPYRGLNAFTEEHARFFFGQEHYIDRLVNRLRQDIRFLPIFGPSGSGKSSVVQAGLLPRIRQGDVGNSLQWEVIVMRPADDPFQQYTPDGLGVEAHNLVEAVKHWFAQHEQYSRLVLVVDQFEEAFATHFEGANQQFIPQLITLLGSPLPVTVILVMRDDFYNYFVKDPALREWLEWSGGPINIPQNLTLSEVTSVIRKPAEAVKLRFEDGLVEMIVKDTLETLPSLRNDRPSARSTILPLLEFTLTRLWERREDGVLKRDVYVTIGGVTGGLTQWADQVFYNLENEEQRQEARRILTTLVYVGDDSQRLPDRRRRIPINLLTSDKDKLDVTQQVIQQLTNGKLLITDYDMHSNQEMVEIIHDALLWEWGQMKRWLQDDRTFLLWLQAFEQRVQAWVKTNMRLLAKREKEKLLRGSELTEAMSWLKQRHKNLSQDDQVFILTSQNIQQRRLITTIISSTILTATVMGGGVWWLLDQIPRYTSIATYTRHQGPVYCVAWSPEGTRLASGSADRTVQVFLSHGEHVYTYRGHKSTVTALAWAPDGYRIASTSGDHTVQIWYSDGQSSQKPSIYTGHMDIVLAVAWSPDSRYIASGSEDGLVHIWEADTKKLLYSYRGHAGPVNTVAWSPLDRGRLASGSGDSTVHVWNMTSGKPSVIYTGHKKPSHVTSVAWSPNGKYIASAGFDGTAQVWSAESGDLHYIYRGHRYTSVTCVTWSPDNVYVASASADKTVQIWTALDGRLICTYNDHTKEVEAVAWARPVVPQSQAVEPLIASASADKSVRIWQLKQ